MKSLIRHYSVLLVLMSVALSLFPQIPDEMRNKRWLDNEEHHLYGYTIVMLFGEKYSRYRHTNTGEMTSMAYQSLDQVVDSLKSQGKRESWEPAKLQEKIDYYKQKAPGGRIFFYISRYEESDANTKWYFVIIHDQSEQKIVEKNLDYQAPQMPEGTGWWNYYEFLIDRPIPMPFIVDLNKNVTNHLTDFRFSVKPDK